MNEAASVQEARENTLARRLARATTALRQSVPFVFLHLETAASVSPTLGSTEVNALTNDRQEMVPIERDRLA